MSPVIHDAELLCGISDFRLDNIAADSFVPVRILGSIQLQLQALDFLLFIEGCFLSAFVFLLVAFDIILPLYVALKVSFGLVSICTTIGSAHCLFLAVILGAGRPEARNGGRSWSSLTAELPIGR